MLQHWAPTIGQFLIGAVGTILCLAALHDVLARTVPNWMPIALFIIGCVERVLDGRIVTSLLIGALVFIVTGLCWKRGWLGGGDVKLLAAAAVAVPPMAVPPFIAAVALAGGVLSLAYLALSRLIPRAVLRRPSAWPVGRPSGVLPRVFRLECWRLSRGGPLPYAVAIATGGLFVLL
jgi:prepilin peptidase CpaA